MAAQAIAEEGRLVDHLGALAESLFGLAHNVFKRSERSVGGWGNLDNVETLFLQRLQVAQLVIVPLLGEKRGIGPGFELERDLPVRLSEVQLGQMAAGQVVTQVARREDEPIIEEL